MKVLLFIHSKYSLGRSLETGFKSLGYETKIIDFRKIQQKIFNKYLIKFSTLSSKLYNKFQKDLINAINRYYLELIKAELPDIIFIYNDELFDPEVLASVKGKSKIVFFLGDNPINYSPGTSLNIDLLFYADYIISPDSFWIEQLAQIGIKNLHFDIIASDPQTFYSIENQESEKAKNYMSDLVFIGRAYQSSWGYKRALFLSRFCNFDLRLFATGKGWAKWFQHFPELEKKVTHQNINLSLEDINNIYNSSKINLVDCNAGLPKGVHLRVCDSIAAGILPLMEYRADLERVFPVADLPIIKDYNEAADLAKHFLNDYVLRKKIVDEMKKIIDQNYSPKILVNRIMRNIFK